MMTIIDVSFKDPNEIFPVESPEKPTSKLAILNVNNVRWRVQFTMLVPDTDSQASANKITEVFINGFIHKASLDILQTDFPHLEITPLNKQQKNTYGRYTDNLYQFATRIIIENDENFDFDILFNKKISKFLLSDELTKVKSAFNSFVNTCLFRRFLGESDQYKNCSYKIHNFVFTLLQEPPTMKINHIIYKLIYKVYQNEDSPLDGLLKDLENSDCQELVNMAIKVDDISLRMRKSYRCPFPEHDKLALERIAKDT